MNVDFQVNLPCLLIGNIFVYPLHLYHEYRNLSKMKRFSILLQKLGFFSVFWHFISILAFFKAFWHYLSSFQTLIHNHQHFLVKSKTYSFCLAYCELKFFLIGWQQNIKLLLWRTMGRIEGNRDSIAEYR